MPGRARLLWLWHRLSAMSVPEVGHRLLEQGRRWRSRTALPDFDAMVSDDEVLPAVPGLRAGLSALSGQRELLDDWQRLAAATAGNELCLLGQRWPPNEATPDWHLDPVSGAHWPAQAFCFDIPFRHAAATGDVKFVWELGRLQYLQPLAALAALRRDRDLAQLVCAHLHSWIEANPPYRGVAWASGIELSLRVVSLLVIVSCLGDLVPSGLRRPLLRSLAAHGFWLDRFPSRYSSANNHRVAEAGSLYLLGRLAPGLRDARRWGDVGRRALAAEVMRQFHADGVGAEQSPTYGAFSLEWFLLCGVVARELGEPFAPDYWQRLHDAGGFLRALTDRAGHQPRIGDDDEGRVMLSAWFEPDYVNGVLAALAAVAGRAELAPPHPRPHLRWALTGPPPPPQPPPSGMAHFPTGGYSVIRDGTGEGERLLVLDHGPLGFLSIAAHGHADALALWLHLGGRPVLVDAGTFLYHAGGAWRDHFRGTAAHNTLVLEGADSSVMTGPFNWGARAGTNVRELVDTPGRWVVEAEHDGYLRRFGLRHRRRLAVDADGSIEVQDSLHGRSEPRRVEIGFLFAPGLGVREIDGQWQVGEDERPLLSLRHLGSLTAHLDLGTEAPLRGWQSPRFNRRQPAPRLAFVGELAPETSVVTAFQLLAP